jgi:hypothetical protein
VDRATEAISQLLVDQIDIGIQVCCQDMVRTITIRLIALFDMAGFDNQITIFDRSPDMTARVAISPFKDQPVFVLIETALSIEKIPIEHL